MELKERLNKLFDNRHVTSYEVSQKTGISQSTLRRVLNGDTLKLSIKSVDLLANYFNVDALWISTGIEKTKSTSETQTHAMKKPQITESEHKDNESFQTGKENAEKIFTIPLIPFDAVAGFANYDNDGIRYEDCEQYAVPEFQRCGVEFVIRVSGSSMYPKYSNGDVLACRKISEILFFQWGKVYVIDTSQGVLVKRILKHEDPDFIILASDNKEKYDPFPLPVSDIRSLSIVIGVIRME